MKQLLVRKGAVVVSEVPAPTVGARNILVRLSHSCVSIGTEVAGVRMSAMPLWKRVLKQPHHAKKVVQLMRDQGAKRVWDRVTGMLAAGTPTGYSAAGEVVAVGDQVDGFAVGDLVACAGAGIANHAEYIDVPVNLAVRIPAGLETEHACTVTLGAIAMQGVRRATPTLGETFVVVGMGILGQITDQLLRAHGCRVIVGDVGLNLQRHEFFSKEVDVLISASYEPGRYDPVYEVEGQDYPLPYVRWTENRNMEEYLRLIGEGRMKVSPLVSEVYPVAEADAAYEKLKSGANKPLMVLPSYPEVSADAQPVRKIANPRGKKIEGRKVKLALVGAGGFAKGMHLPNLQSLDAKFGLQAVVSRTGHNASATATNCAASYSTTEFAQVLADRDVNAVLIAMRHDLHAPMTLEALKVGKHVLVEKPTVISHAQLADITDWFASQIGETLRLLTGFNHRFSPYARRIQELIANRAGPLMMTHRMNAGHLPPDHWTHGGEGGGRNVGEACHIYDLFTYFANSKVGKVAVAAARPATKHFRRDDNFTATMEFADGSVATLTYTAFGTSQHPKEELEIFVDGKVIVLGDYKSLTITGSKAKGMTTTLPEKGQKAELEAFGNAILKGGEWPIPLWQQVQAMQIAFTA